MPTEEFTYTRAQMGVFAHEAHLIRTRDRIAFWKHRIDEPMGSNDVELASAEIQLLERQLLEPYTKRILAATPVSEKASPQELPVVFAEMFKGLQSEIAQLKQKLTGTKEDAPSNGAIPVGQVAQAPAETL